MDILHTKFQVPNPFQLSNWHERVDRLIHKGDCLVALQQLKMRKNRYNKTKNKRLLEDDASESLFIDPFCFILAYIRRRNCS